MKTKWGKTLPRVIMKVCVWGFSFVYLASRAQWFGKHSTSFVEKRRLGLEHYLQQLAKDPSFYRHKVFLDFLRTSDKHTGQHQVILFGVNREEGTLEDEQEEEARNFHAVIPQLA